MLVHESSGIPLLGQCVMALSVALNKELKKYKFGVWMEFRVIINTHIPGKNPSSDATVVAIVVVAKANPVVLYEYKPVVDT